MPIYKNIEKNKIDSEILELKKPNKYKKGNFNYHDLGSRGLECLLYLIFKHNVDDGKYSGEYDRVQLMQRVGEKGRDVLLTFQGKHQGVIQCKNYDTTLDKPKIIKEIVKYVLYYYKERHLINNLSQFTYYIVAPRGFSGSGIELLTDFKQASKEKYLQKWTEVVIKKYVSIQDLIYSEIKDFLIDTLEKLNVKEIIKIDLDLALEKHEKIKSLFFKLDVVITEEPFKKILDSREFEKIDTQPSIDDSRIPILEGLIKNLTIKYYSEQYPTEINHKLIRLISIIGDFKANYTEQFITNGSLSTEKIIKSYFGEKHGPNLSIQFTGKTKFQHKIDNGEIFYEKITNRSLLNHAGDLAFLINEEYQNNFERTISLDTLRQKYENLIQAKYINRSFREKYLLKRYQEILKILEEKKIINTSGLYTGSDCTEICKIRNPNKLQDFITKFSLEQLILNLNLNF